MHNKDNPVVFNYKEFPHLPRSGIHAESNLRFRTVSLFLETCPKGSEDEVKWSLSETEQWCEVTQRWIPSAWMCYIYAENEYDAMRKIVGNIRQWEMLKGLKWFKEKFSMWEAEQDMMIKATIRSSLERTVLEGGQGSTTASKMLLDYFSHEPKKPRQKTSTAKTKEQTKQEDDVASDLARITPLTRTK